jgi:hypothetical protein
MKHIVQYASDDTTNVVPSSLTLFTLKMTEGSPSEASVLTRPTRRHIPEDCILHSHHRENLQSLIIMKIDVFWDVTQYDSCKTRRFGGICASETSLITTATRRNISEDGIPHSHRRENLKSCSIFMTINI